MNLKEFFARTKAVDLAKSLKLSPVLTSQWANGVRRVPADRCIEIEKKTDGAVTCEEMRPDIDWTYLRNSKQDDAT